MILAATRRPAGRRVHGVVTPLAAAMALAILVALVPAAPARAAGCFPAGGQAMPRYPGATGDIVINGRGFGHGIGMSQWGAQGAAKLGCSVTDILTTYYPGTTVATATMPSRIRVGIVPNRPAGPLVDHYDVKATAGVVSWRLRTTDPRTGEPLSLDVNQSSGRTWRVEVRTDGSFVVRDLAVPNAPVLAGGDGRSALTARLEGATTLLPKEGHSYRRGTLEFFPRTSGTSANGMYVTLVVADTAATPAMDAYLYGLAEMPSSWEPAALQAQAVVGRAYALAQYETYRGNRSDCRCDLFDTTSSQHYTAWDKEGERTYGTRWVNAVDATRGRVLQYNGRTATGFYSSSSGGHTEANAFVWGGSQLGYLRPVDDSRWDRASGNPNQAWSVGLSAEDLTRKLAAIGVDVGTVQSLSLPAPRGVSGRIGDPARGAGGLLVQGSRGSARISGNVMRTALGLRSTLVEVSNNLTCAAPTGVDPADLRVRRVAGANRIDTAVALSRAHWSTARTAVVASAASFPDALAGGALAAQLDAPILLTPPTGVPQTVRDELRRLGVQDVHVLGGSAALGTHVVAELEAIGVRVARIGGDDRYATAGAIAARVGPPRSQEILLALGNHPVDGRAWPDAVAAGALQAGTAPMPLLLTTPERLPSATAHALTALHRAGARTVIVVGGESAIPRRIETAIAALGLKTTRLEGADRYATSAAVVAAAVARGAAPDRLVAATGTAFPDALSAGAVAARTNAPLILVDACDLGRRPGTVSFLDARGPFREFTLVGGIAAVGERVRWQLNDRLSP